MQEYGVCLKVDARLYMYVEAESIEEARAIAEREAGNCDLNELEWIDTEAIYVDNEHGDIIWEA